MGATSVRRLVGRPVRIGSLRVGVVDEVVLGADLSIVLGVVVETDAAKRCFLPWVAVRVHRDSAVEAAATTTLLGPVELEYYLRSGTPSSSLLGLALHGGPRDGNGVVRDVVIATGGDVEAFAVSHGGRTRRVALAETRVRWAEGRLLELSTGSPTSRADASDRMDAAAAAL